MDARNARDCGEGEVVQLRSGGPQMVVEVPSIGGELMKCIWFDGGELRTGNFRPAVLMPAALLNPAPADAKPRAKPGLVELAPEK